MTRADNSNDPRPPGRPPEQPPEEAPRHYPKVVGRDGNLYVSCAEVISFLFEYLSRELEPVRRADFERHLARCSSCRAYLASYRDTILLARGTFAEGGDADHEIGELPDDLVRAILAAR